MNKRKITFILLIVLMFVMSFNVDAASNKQAITSVVKTFMSGCKSESRKKIKSTVYDTAKFDDLESGDRPAEMKTFYTKRKNANKKITYSIKSIKISGKKATVKVKVKSPTAKQALYNTMVDLVLYSLMNPEASEEEISKFTGASVNSNLKEYPIKMFTHTCTMNLVKTSKGWKIKLTDSLRDIYLCQSNAALKKFLS